jgi:hypothetical protein
LGSMRKAGVLLVEEVTAGTSEEDDTHDRANNSYREGVVAA